MALRCCIEIEGGSMSNATCPPACSGCRDNFVLPELHQHGPLTVFDGPAVRGQIERRRACMLVPDSEKPCLTVMTQLVHPG